ncbi:hypothetical protein [Eubacterium ramulus]|uniref:hypothetical protein n=1 Tax=Eubacterium ramulus TaxID=39490 RepID=UPI0022E70F74|nr:hypothetical protein [Eubacterium ramulus]
MDGNIFISFDKSQDDIPVLTVFKKYEPLLGPSTISVLNCITGDDAVDIYKKLTGKRER